MRSVLGLTLAFSAALASGAGTLTGPVPAAIVLPPTVYPQRRRSRPLTHDDQLRLHAAAEKRERKAAQKAGAP